MKFYPRKIQERVEELLAEFRIVYLNGPRQSGKTTLARMIAKKTDRRFITLDDAAVRSAIEFDPHGFIQSLEKDNVVLDEFQYAPNLIPAIKEASDALPIGANGKFLLTGSSDIFRSARTQESLPGHMARLTLYPLSHGEISDSSRNMIDYLLDGDFQSGNAPFISREDYASMIINGGYPALVGKGVRARNYWFDSYIQGRIFKDFASTHFAKGDYEPKLRALIYHLAGISGNLLKYASIANDLALNDKTIKAYIEVLELMFIIRRISPYVKNPSKRLALQSSKLHFVDTGLACHLLGIRTDSQMLASRHYGYLLENWTFMEFCKHAGWSQVTPRFYFYRNKHQNEVDFVLEPHHGSIVGVEIKASATVSNRDFSGLFALAKYAGNSFTHGVLLYTGKQVLPFTQQGVKLFAIPIGLILTSQPPMFH